MVLKRDYDPSNLDLASQLEELTVHEGRGHGLSFAGDDARWLYNHPTERLEVHISANSGDIILLANARYGYQFGAPNRGQHGSLTYADSLVPVAFAFPGAMTGDTTLEPIVSLLKSLQTETVADSRLCNS